MVTPLTRRLSVVPPTMELTLTHLAILHPLTPPPNISINHQGTILGPLKTPTQLWRDLQHRTTPSMVLLTQCMDSRAKTFPPHNHKI